MRRTRVFTGVAVLAALAGAAHAQQAQDGAQHLCASYVDAGSGQTRLIDMAIESDDPLRGTIDMGEGRVGFIGRRSGERCAILTNRLRLDGLCTPGAFAGRFTFGPRGGDDDEDGPPPTPVRFEPAACS